MPNFERFTGGLSSILLKPYRSSTQQFELKMVAESVIPLWERKGFLLKHLNVDLKIELYFCYNGYGSTSYLNLLTSTSSFLEFYTVETRSLLDVYFRGYISEVGG